MKIIGYTALGNRNIYAHKKCIRLDLDLEGYAEIPSCNIEGFNERLVQLVPELADHYCGIEEKGGFLKRLKEGTYLAHICEHTILALQNRLGIDVYYGKAREIAGERYYIIYQYEYENVGREIGKAAVDMINAVIGKKGFDLELRMLEIKKIFQNEQMGPSTQAIYTAAKSRGIPVRRIGTGSLLQLGYGKSAKMVEATIGCNTSCIAVDIACDKLLTKEVLHASCIPVALGGRVANIMDLLMEGEAIGYPLVLKPRYGNQGKGVIVGIKNEKELMEAYSILSKEYEDILIEKCLEGRDYRVCVVDGKVVAVSERVPPYVIGNGKSTIKELIDIANQNEMRGEGHEKPLTKIKEDRELLLCIEEQGCTMDSILPRGKKIKVRKNANLSTGGIAIDCTDLISKDNIELCIRAAKAVGLDVCGLDVCCRDISKPIEEQEGAIIEVNAAPGIRMHHYPYMGKPRDVAGAIVEMMYKNEPKSIPIVSITGTNGKTTTTRLIAHTLALAGYCVGMTTTGGIYINNECIIEGDTTGPKSALTVLCDKEVEVAVLETARGGMIREGLAYDLADVGVITNITEDHLGIDGIETLEQMAFVKALVGEAVKEDGYVVLNADDKMTEVILERIKHDIIFFSRSRENHLIQKSLHQGGTVIYSDKEYVYIEKENDVYPLMKIEDIGISLNGKLLYNIENAMAACGALIGLKISADIIKRGMESFYGDDKFNPGRCNIYSIDGVTVILDYGHNIEGYKAVMEGIKKIDHKRRIGVIGIPGDRLNSSIKQIGKMSGDYFDYIFIKEDMDKRGRRVGEIAKVLKEGAYESKVDKNNIEIILDEKEALRKALEIALPGDLVIIFFEKYEGLLNVIFEKKGQKDTALSGV